MSLLNCFWYSVENTSCCWSPWWRESITELIFPCCEVEKIMIWRRFGKGWKRNANLEPSKSLCAKNLKIYFGIIWYFFLIYHIHRGSSVAWRRSWSSHFLGTERNTNIVLGENYIIAEEFRLSSSCQIWWAWFQNNNSIYMTCSVNSNRENFWNQKFALFKDPLYAEKSLFYLYFLE